MTLYKKCLVLSTEALVGENNLLQQKSWLDTALVLSKMKIFYKIRQDENESLFDISNYLIDTNTNKNLYPLIGLEILYLINFKKKFTQKNMNRIIENYFKIVFFSIRKKINMVTAPTPVIDDFNYLTTLSLSNLYTISKFNYDHKDA
uniref:ORF146 n=1 Tax=Rhodomonas salina TaxID=3034 RepID=A6MVQ7_RHDSA|nr:ORF146 [Rhodomonas salina]ABO70859.1 ORF146 [Rhodomonas salina]